MFLFQPIHFLKFWGKSQPQLTYKMVRIKKKSVFGHLVIQESTKQDNGSPTPYSLPRYCLTQDGRRSNGQRKQNVN